MASQTFHIRSISLPSKSQQEVIRIEEEIKALKSIVASSSGATTVGLKNSLREIGNIYESIKVILQLPSNQGVIFSTINKKWMEKELDESIKVLDLCTNIRGCLVLVKDHAQELSLALRRKDKLLQSGAKDYVCSLKKAKKDTKNYFKSLKKAQSKDSDLHMVIRLLIELRHVTTSLLRSVFSSFSMPETEVKVWSFISKKEEACSDDKLQDPKEMESLEDIEKGLDCLYRHLILNRVSLSNIISL